jgi:hypothetical protein
MRKTRFFLLAWDPAWINLGGIRPSRTIGLELSRFLDLARQHRENILNLPGVIPRLAQHAPARIDLGKSEQQIDVMGQESEQMQRKRDRRRRSERAQQPGKSNANPVVVGTSHHTAGKDTL